MEYQGKKEKQVKDSERFAFWGMVCFFITIIALIANADVKKEENYPPKSIIDTTTVEVLKKDSQGIK